MNYVVALILANISIWAILSIIPRVKNKNKVFLIISFLSIWIFLSIREPYSDTISYQRYFQNLEIGHFEQILENRWEILFKALLYGIRLITDNPSVMLFIVSFITLIGPYLFIKRYSKNYLLSIVMFISIGSFYMQFFILRQAIALSIFLSFFYLITEKKFIRYSLSILIATLFHKTAIVLLLLYPLSNLPTSKLKNIVVSGAAILCIIFSPQILLFLTSGTYKEYSDGSSSGGVLLLLFYISMYLIYTIIRVHSPDTKENNAITNSSLFSIFWQCFAIQNNIFCRLANYTRDSFCIVIPNIIYSLDDKNSKLLCSGIVIAICICFIAVSNDFNSYNIALP